MADPRWLQHAVAGREHELVALALVHETHPAGDAVDQLERDQVVVDVVGHGTGLGDADVRGDHPSATATGKKTRYPCRRGRNPTRCPLAASSSNPGAGGMPTPTSSRSTRSVRSVASEQRDGGLVGGLHHAQRPAGRPQLGERVDEPRVLEGVAPAHRPRMPSRTRGATRYRRTRDRERPRRPHRGADRCASASGSACGRAPRSGVRRRRRRDRGCRLRQPVAVGADQRPGARPDRGDVVRRRPHHPAQVRDERARAARSQPGRARQGAGDARRSCPAGGCCRRSGSGSPTAREHQAFGVERTERAAWFDEALAVMRACWTRRAGRPPRRALPLRGPGRPAGAGAARRLARRHRPVRAAPGRAARRRLVAIVRDARRRSRRRRVIEAVADRARPGDRRRPLRCAIPYLGDAAPRSPTQLAAGLHKRRPDLDDPHRLVPAGWDALGDDPRFVDVGTTKFVSSP